MRHLQDLHEKLKDKGLVILGFNCSDNKQIALDFLNENEATFPNILDASETARKTGKDYKMTGVPLNYIIDRQGNVVEGWYGDYKKVTTILEKLGIK